MKRTFRKLASLCMAIIICCSMVSTALAAVNVVDAEDKMVTGYIVEYEAVDAGKKTFQVNVYTKSNAPQMGWAFQMGFDATKVKLYDPINEKEFTDPDLDDVPISFPKYTLNGKQISIDDAKKGWIASAAQVFKLQENYMQTSVYVRPALSIAIRNAAGLIPNDVTTGGVKLDASTTKLFSIQFVATGTEAYKNLKSSDFSIDPVSEYTKISDAGHSGTADILYRNFPGDRVKTEIASAAVTVTAPVAQAKPDTDAKVALGVPYAPSSAVTWTNSSGTAVSGSFAYDTDYTAKVALTPVEGYQFAAAATATMNNQSATATLETDGTLTVSYTFRTNPKQNTAPVVKAGQDTQAGVATPPSADGNTPAVPYTGNMSDWFADADGDPLAYSVSGSGQSHATTSDSTLTYTPIAADAGKTVTLVVKATDGTADSTSNVTVTITVGAVPADKSPDTPVIVTGSNKTATYGAISGDISVTATVTDVGTLSYQWYRGTGATDVTPTDGKKVGTNASTLTVPTTLTAGIHYYFCQVTNTKNGQTSKAVSNVIAVTVNQAELTITWGAGTYANMAYLGKTNKTVAAPTAGAPTLSNGMTPIVAYERASMGVGDVVAVKATITDFTGTGSANYKLPATAWKAGHGTVKVSPVVLILTANNVAVTPRDYNGQTTIANAAVTGTPTLSGVLSGDVCTAALDSAVYTDANAGNNKAANVTYTLTGAEADNYTCANLVLNLTNQTITPAAITGKPTISDTMPTIGDTLTADVTGVTPSGAQAGLTYQWKVGVNNVATGGTRNTYTVVAADAGKAITVSVTGAGNYKGTVASDATSAVAKKTRPAAAPTDVTSTATTITYTPTIGQKYLVNTSPSATEADMSGAALAANTNPVKKSGLAANTTYYIHTYLPGDGEFADSAVVSVSRATVAKVLTVELTGDLAFSPITYGDGQPAAKAFTVQNTGSENNQTVTLTLTGTNASSFTLSKASVVLNAGASDATITVRPNDKLVAGTYTAKLKAQIAGGAAVERPVSITVGKKAITGITGETATKVYDTTNTLLIGQLSGTPVFTGMVAGDTLEIASITASYNTANAHATPAAVSVTAITLGGASKDNYTIDPLVVTEITGTVSKKQLTWTPGTVSATKEYDGTKNDAILSGAPVLAGMAGSETVVATVTGGQKVTFKDNANVGTAHTYDVTSDMFTYTYDAGAVETNYILPTGTLALANGKITASPLTAVGNITGTVKVGGTLTIGAVAAHNSEIPAPTTDYTIQWFRADSDSTHEASIDAAVDANYTLTTSDIGKIIYAKVTGVTNYSGMVTTQETGVVPKLALTAIAEISGTAKFGQELTAGVVTPDTATVTYQWYRSDTNDNSSGASIAGATSNKYTLAEADVGKYIYVQVTGTDNYSGTVSSTQTAQIAKADAPSAPVGVDKVDVVANDDTTGKLTGVSALMEYATENTFASPTAITETTVTGLPAGTYYVRIKETATTLAGAASSGLVIAPTVPNKVTGVAASGNGQLVITWAKPKMNGGIFAKYVVDIKTGGASGTSVATYPKNITAGVDTLTETVTGLTNGTAYTITVQAFNNVGAGAGSDSINATPSGGGGGGSVGGGGGATPSESIELKQPKTDPVTGNTNVEIAAKPETKGDTSTAVIPDKVMTDAISSVVKEAAKTGGTSSVEIVIDAPKDAKSVEAELTRTIIRAVAESEVGSLKITSPVAIITFDTQALATIAAEAAEEKVIISAVSVPEKKLDAAQKALVGDAPVYELKVMSGNKIISDFKGGTATITIPYELKAGEKAEFVTVWYLDDAGKLSPIQGKYEDGFVTFTVGHFSRYAIGYLPFTDVKADWAYESIVYAYQNKLLSGVGSEKFAPADNMTRAMLWTVLYRAAGSPAKTDNANWYADAQAWAMAEKISDGTNPTGNVTRQELATILYRHAKSTAVQADMSGFSDMAEVAEWAADGMNWAVANGILKGIGDKLNPAGNATRAQVATMLQRYLTK